MLYIIYIIYYFIGISNPDARELPTRKHKNLTVLSIAQIIGIE